MNKYLLATITTAALTGTLMAAPARTPAATSSLPRTADGKPDLQGIWQAESSAAADLQDHVASLNMIAGRSVIAGGKEIPYQPWAAKQRAENFQNRQTADPFSKCYIPGVPRVMYIDFPFQIFQTPKTIAMAFEWELDLPPHLHGRLPAPRRRRFLDGRFARPLGWRHPCCGRRQQ